MEFAKKSPKKKKHFNHDQFFVEKAQFVLTDWNKGPNVF